MEIKKVVINFLPDRRVIIGIEGPDTDPYFETVTVPGEFEEGNPSQIWVVEQVPLVIARGSAVWAETPKGQEWTAPKPPSPARTPRDRQTPADPSPSTTQQGQQQSLF